MDAQQKLPTTSAEPSKEPPPYTSAPGQDTDPPAYQPPSAPEVHNNAALFTFAAANNSPSHSTRATTTTVTPHCTFPPLMTTHSTWSLRSLAYLGQDNFFICGATPTNRLFLVEQHVSGLSKPPLGERTGCVLHNGLTMQDPILAAAGENLAGELRFRWDYLNTSSVIMLSDAAAPGGFTTEIMSGLTSTNGEVMFRWALEVGTAEKMRREEFEWVKFEKGDDGENKAAKGYKLFRYNARPELQGDTGVGSSSGAARGYLRQRIPFAVLTWGRRLNLISYLFTIKLMETAQGLSEQWKLMVVMTALRLGYLRAQGATNKTVVRHSAAGDKEV